MHIVCMFCNVQGNLCAVVGLYSTFKRFVVIVKGRGSDIVNQMV